MLYQILYSLQILFQHEDSYWLTCKYPTTCEMQGNISSVLCIVHRIYLFDKAVIYI